MYLYFWGMIPTIFSKISISIDSSQVSDIRFRSFKVIYHAIKAGLRGPVAVFLLLIISFGASAQYQSLCWQISGNGLKHPSYLYGTMHVSARRVFNFGDKANKAFAESKAYAMEIDPEKAMSLSTLTKMMMTGGTRISKLIPDSDYRFIDSVMTLSMGHGMSIFNAMEPIIVSSVLDEYGMGISKSDSTNMADAMDIYFFKKAKKEKKTLIGIETIDEQINALHTLNYQEQAELLLQSIQDLKKGEKNTNSDLMKFYLAQNLDSIMAISDEEQMPPKLYKAMITDRNIRMADRMAEFIQKKATFIAIGAMHLPGEGGVIELLRKKGYKVEMWR